MSTYDSWKSTDPRDGEPDWNNEREQDEDADNRVYSVLRLLRIICLDCQHGYHEAIGTGPLDACPCPCHGGQQ